MFNHLPWPYSTAEPRAPAKHPNISIRGFGSRSRYPSHPLCGHHNVYGCHEKEESDPGYIQPQSSGERWGKSGDVERPEAATKRKTYLSFPACTPGAHLANF